MPLFEIVFQGQVRDDVTPEQARARIGQLFQIGEEQLALLFSGRRVVIKQGLEEAAADKYRQAIERAGAVCSVVPMGNEPVEQAAPAPSAAAETPAPAPAAPVAASATGKSKLVPRDEFMAAFTDVEAPDFDIAPVGADMQDDYVDFTPLPIDLSALSLAPPGADLDELKRDVEVNVPNTDHLKLAD